MQSLSGQDYPSLEIVVSDNCSTDNTEEVVREAARDDSRIRYVRHSHNIGLHANHNVCFDAASGTYICVWHDHDARERTIVSEYVAFFERHPTVGVVCSDWNLINDAGEEIGVRDHDVAAVTSGMAYIEQTMRSGRTSIGIPGAMVRAAALGDARFVVDAPIGFGDFPLWFRVAETWDVGHINRRLWSWRQNSESHSARTIESIARDYDENLTRYCDDHLQRRPDHAAVVTRWRASIRHYLFWALAYEVALHCRHRTGTPARGDRRSLFEIMDYRLSPQQFQNAVSQMKAFRTSTSEYVACAGVLTLIRLRLTWPVAWLSRHQAALRTVLGLK